ncbi:hypothetical protein T459_23107 [Capsicum annuum]|uniref:Dirigent protein n=1 Tax=Capsicum annuum TaxID=4072 RepID=A0A2G2YRE7_CAPAN|nr:hypothetical protein T459_23107 [Capsicum annuum]
MSSLDSSFWKEAVNSEIDSILSNHTWELVDLPLKNKLLGSKWIFKRKMKEDDTIDKYKARLIVKGFKQKKGLDYFDTYSPVTRITSIRMLIASVAVYDFQIHQIDVKTAFLNGDLEEEIYMEQLEGFVVPEKENKILCTRSTNEVTATSGTTEANPVLDHPMFSSFMHDILGGSRPRVVTGIIANSDANNLPFSKPNNQIFPINVGVPVNTINNVVNNNNYPYLVGLNGQEEANTVLQNSSNNNIVNGGNSQPFPFLAGHKDFYLTSSSDGTSHTLALTALFHGEHDHEVDHSISFFEIRRTATPISHIAITGGTGKYENAKGYATIETLPHVDQHTTDGVETITHFTVYLTP